MAYVKPQFLVDHDHLADACSNDRDFFRENLCCMAMVHWEKAARGADLTMFDKRLFARAAADPDSHAREALAMVKAAIERLRSRAAAYRSNHLDDMGHLRLQSERDTAVPELQTGMGLLGFAVWTNYGLS